MPPSCQGMFIFESQGTFSRSTNDYHCYCAVKFILTIYVFCSFIVIFNSQTVVK